MKPRAKVRFLLASILLGGALAVGIYFMARVPQKQPMAAAPVEALEPLRIEHSAPQTSATLRPAVLKLLDPGTPARARIDLAMACDRDLNNDELLALLAEVSTPPTTDVDAGWHSQYLHEICLQLHHHQPIRKRLARVLVGIVADTSRSQVEREYAVQHLREVWHRAADDNSLRQALVASFKTLLENSVELAGPALLSLHFLGNDPGRGWNRSSAIIGNGEIEPLVSKLLKQSRDNRATGAVMAALRVSGDRALDASMQSIKQVAADSSVPSIVRMAAISIIAKSGKDSASFLQSINPSEPLVAQAIHLSLKNSR